MPNKKSRLTQHLANTFPPWSDAREDEQSLAWQFLNIVAQPMEDLARQNIRFRDSLYLPSSPVSDVGLRYSLALPGDFVFEKNDADPSDLIFTPPRS